MTRRRPHGEYLPKEKSRSAREPVPVLKFTISINSRESFQVKIFKTPAEMRRFLKIIRPDMDHRDDWCFTDEESSTLVASLWTCTDSCIAHEVVHVVFWLYQKNKRRGLKYMAWDTPEHEKLAETIGDLVSQFWFEFTRAGFKRTECWGFPQRGRK